jgi:hypothetical protein
MRRAAALVTAAFAFASASAGANAARPALALTAAPARVALAGSSRATVRVSNPGRWPVAVEVARAGFALDMRGRPRVVPRSGPRAATSWLTVRPARFVLGPGASRPLTVTSRLPRRVEPGDHDALVLLTTRPQRGAGVAVRARLGLVVVVRAPGRVVRRLIVRGVQVRRMRQGRVVEVLVANRGTVSETLAPGAIRVALQGRPGRATLRSAGRELRPRTSGVVSLRPPRRLKGWVTTLVRIAPDSGRPAVARTFRVRL